MFYIDNHYGRHRFDTNFSTFGQLNLGEILRDWLLNELARPHNVDLVLDCLDVSKHLMVDDVLLHPKLLQQTCTL
jgi:hypothetical protein